MPLYCPKIDRLRSLPVTSPAPSETVLSVELVKVLLEMFRLLIVPFQVSIMMPCRRA